MTNGGHRNLPAPAKGKPMRKLCVAALTALTADDELEPWFQLLRGSTGTLDLDPGFVRHLKETPPTRSSRIPFPGAPTDKGPLGQLEHYHIVAQVGTLPFHIVS